MRYGKVTRIFLGALFISSLANIPWHGATVSAPALNGGGHSIVLAGMASDVFRDTYISRSSAPSGADVAKGSASSAFERRIARPARPATAEAGVSAPAPVFSTGTAAGGCGAVRVAEVERPWCANN